MKNKKNKILCIRCPKGCELKIKEKNGDIIVFGNECAIGEKYAIKETKNPERVVTSTVRIKNARYPRLPVRTQKPIPKNKIEDVIKSLQNITLNAPIKHHDIIIKNVADTKINVISERNMERVEK